MARHSITRPDGVEIDVGGDPINPGGSRVWFPLGTETFNARAWFDADASTTKSGRDERVSVYLPGVPVGTTKAELEQMIEDMKADVLASGEKYGRNTDPKTPVDLEEFDDWENE